MNFVYTLTGAQEHNQEHEHWEHGEHGAHDPRRRGEELVLNGVPGAPGTPLLRTPRVVNMIAP